VDQHWSRFQQQLENPLWAIALGIAAFLAGVAVWFAVWQVWIGLVYIGGIVHLSFSYWFLFVRTPMERAISFGLLFSTVVTLAYRIVPGLLA
jgi:hypothetical protein